MKIGDLVKIEIYQDIFSKGIIISARQKELPDGSIEEPNDYAYNIMLLGENKVTPVFENEIVEIISENR